jgi:hypothetical protein
MSYLDFPKNSTLKKTPEFGVKSGGMTLGKIKWYAPWRRLCFFPGPGSVYDAACLEEIVAKTRFEDEAYKTQRRLKKVVGK